MKTVVPLSTDGINEMINQLNDFKEWQKNKAAELAERLAEYGADIARVKFVAGSHLGIRDEKVTVEPIRNGYVVKAEGKSVLFLEFGAGITYGFGHPEAQEHRMGPGTYPDGKGHWNDPNGWWLPKSAGGGHTYGNPPTMAMYEARKRIEIDLPRIVREVFR